MISATAGDGVGDLKRALAGAMPEGPWHYPEDQLTDATDRMIAAELTREQLYAQLYRELPYAAVIETETWEDRQDGSTEIRQQIQVERDSQKAIVIGKGGSRLKAIGEAARREISEHLGRKVHLFLHVKVNPRWDEDRSVYRDICLDEARRWIDRPGGADRNEQVGSLQRAFDTVHFVRHLTEPDDVRAHGACFAAGRTGGAVSHWSSPGKAVVTAQAPALFELAVHVQEPFAPRPFVQVIDVLGHQQELSGPLGI
jgi:hypothetical protein